MGHVPIMLHNLLDDLIFLIVEYTRAEVVLYLVLQDRIFLACKSTCTHKHINRNAESDVRKKK